MARSGPQAKRQIDPGTIVLPSQVAIEGHLTLGQPETSTERSTRLKQTSAAADHERWRDKVILVAITAIVSSTTLLCVAILLVHSYFPAESSRWASVTLTSIISVAIGYLGGKVSKS